MNPSHMKLTDLLHSHASGIRFCDRVRGTRGTVHPQTYRFLEGTYGLVQSFDSATLGSHLSEMAEPSLELIMLNEKESESDAYAFPFVVLVLVVVVVLSRQPDCLLNVRFSPSTSLMTSTTYIIILHPPITFARVHVLVQVHVLGPSYCYPGPGSSNILPFDRPGPDAFQAGA